MSRTCTVTTPWIDPHPVTITTEPRKVITHTDVLRVNVHFGALRIAHADYSETVYAAREWTRYHLSAPDTEPVAAVRDPGQPDVLIEVLADGAVRRPTPAVMPTRRAVG